MPHWLQSVKPVVKVPSSRAFLQLLPTGSQNDRSTYTICTEKWRLVGTGPDRGPSKWVMSVPSKSQLALPVNFLRALTEQYYTGVESPGQWQHY